MPKRWQITDWNAELTDRSPIISPTQEFYRNAIAEQKNLQDNIDELFRIEELKQQEQVARTGYEQAEAMREQKTPS